MGLCLTYRVNLGLSLRKSAQAMKDIHGISISHQMVANYCKTAAVCIKPFVDTYPYKKGAVFSGDETYIKVRGVTGYIWFIIDTVSRAVIGYQVSDNRGVGPCIMAMRMAFRRFSSTTQLEGSGMPERIMSIMAMGSSVLGLSEVMMAISESLAPISPIMGRLVLSRSPPQPKTEMSLPLQ
jgi:hypothetical protein